MADFIEGAAEGAAIGSVVPGVGTVAGGLIGGIGSLFGGSKKKPPPPAPVNKNWDDRYYWGNSPGGAESDVERARRVGATYVRPAPVIDASQSNASRAEQLAGLQYQATGMNELGQGMGLAHNAAMGNAPSAAEIYGQRMIDDSINSQMAMAASARGGPTALAGAARQAAFQGAQMQQGGMRDLAAMRADEMARARDSYIGAANAYGNQGVAYGQSAGSMRGQDIGLATAQAGLANDALNRQQQNQQFYEQQAWNTRKEAQDSALRYKEGADSQWANQRNAKLKEESQDWDKVKDTANFVASTAGSAAMLSDLRTKNVYLPMASDARTKYVVSDERLKEGVLPLYEPPGKQLHQSADGHAFYAAEPSSQTYQASLAGGGSGLSRPSPPENRAAAAHSAPKRRELTYEEMLARAAAMENEMRATHEARMAQGPAVDPMADANRAQEGSIYAYRPEFAAQAGQAPGEQNVGPMAQTMAQNPYAATAVKQDPSTGMLYLDNDKLQKLQSAGIASLQQQIDQLRQGRR